MAMIATTAVDWLQLWCDFSTFFAKRGGGANMDVGQARRSPNYQWAKLDVKTRTFSEVYDVSRNNIVMFTIYLKPYSSVIKATGGLIKVKNELLYKANCVSLVETFLRENSIRFKSISRIDLCVDFEDFANGERPQTVLEKIMCNNYYRMGKSKFFAHGTDISSANVKHITGPDAKGVERDYWVIHNHFDVIGYSDEEERFSYICWGSRLSEVRTYLYDKTRELEEVHMKRYIVQQWNANKLGLDRRHVWRLEFSMKAPQFHIVEQNTGAVINDDWQKFLSTKSRNAIIMALANKYFDIRRNSGQVRKDREEHIEMIRLPSEQTMVVRFEPTPDQTRSMKTMLRKMDAVNDEVRNARRTFYSIIQQAKREYAMQTGLVGWALEHGIDLSEDSKYNDEKLDFPEDCV